MCGLEKGPLQPYLGYISWPTKTAPPLAFPSNKLRVTFMPPVRAHLFAFLHLAFTTKVVAPAIAAAELARGRDLQAYHAALCKHRVRKICEPGTLHKLNGANFRNSTFRMRREVGDTCKAWLVDSEAWALMV